MAYRMTFLLRNGSRLCPGGRWLTERGSPPHDLAFRGPLFYTFLNELAMDAPLGAETMTTSVRTEIAALPVADLARRFGTPTFVYDAAMMLRRLGDLAAFDHVRYAQKACSNLAVLDLLHRHGALVDTVSGGEIRRALAAGYLPEGSPPPIVYTADVFDAEALDLCVERGIHVNCGSPDMIDQLGGRRPAARSRCESTPVSATATAARPTPAAKPPSTASGTSNSPPACARAQHYELAVTGLHMHIGSGTDLEHLSRVCAAMEEAAAVAGPQVTSISAGGGLPVPYRAGRPLRRFGGIFRPLGRRAAAIGPASAIPCGLEIEPGRYLVAESGYLVAEIRAVKQQGPNTFYLVDAGFNNLARPILYGAYHPMSIVPADGRPDRPRARGDCGRAAVRVGRHLHAGGRRLRRPPPPARGRRGRPAGDRVRRGLWGGDGLELQLAARWLPKS